MKRGARKYLKLGAHCLKSAPIFVNVILSRSCGSIYCSTCSDYQYEKHRVCFDCHLHLNMPKTNSTFGSYKYPISIALVYSSVVQIFERQHIVLMILNFSGFDDLIKSCGLDQQTLRIEGTYVDLASPSVTTSLMSAPIHTIMNCRTSFANFPMTKHKHGSDYIIDDNDIRILVNEAHIADVISRMQLYNTSVTWNGLRILVESIKPDSTLFAINGHSVRFKNVTLHKKGEFYFVK